MSATEYTIDIRDIRFVIHEQLRISETLAAYEKFADFDKAMYDQMLDEAKKISVEVIAPTNRDGDRIGCTFDGAGNVGTPDSFKNVWQVLCEGGWLATSADPQYGGLGAPHSLDAAVNEMFTGANPAFSTYPGLARGAANLLVEFAPDTFRQLLCERLYSGQWGGTMCLTEAGAGSDVGASRCKATPSGEPDVYLLEGEKVFITAGDQDLTENIIHLVLARTPGAPEGTRGLSIFCVPKFLFDADGNLGERNGIYVEGIEEKMGIHGSATTTLSLGAKGPCRGWLLGTEHEGIKIMFRMMNEARIGVGIQGLAGAAGAYNMSLSYAKERVQGAAIDRMGDPNAPAIAIVNHPNVRRMLMWQRVHVELMRAMVYETAFVMDKALATDDPEQKKLLMGHVELMTPIVKAYCSDRGFDSTIMAVQVFGGYGYIGEYPVEQYARDTKISSIYEGTNGIQAMDLLGRKMRKGSGILFMNWLGWLNEELDRCREFPEMSTEVDAMEKARDALGAAAMHLGGLAMQGRIKGAMHYAVAFLEQFGCVVLGYHALVQGRLALTRLAEGVKGDDEVFYRGKVLNLKYYSANILPRSISLGKAIRQSDESALDPILFQ